MMTKLYS